MLSQPSAPSGVGTSKGLGNLRMSTDKINQKLWEGFSKFSPADWAGRHTAVSEEEFKREPNRNKFTVLLGRTAHMSYHVGQAMLARPKA